MSRRVLFAHLVVTVLAFAGAMMLASCGAPCVSAHGLRSETGCDDLAVLDRAASALLAEDGLSASTLDGVTLSVHEGSDGSSWAPNDEERADGYTSISGQAFCNRAEVVLANGRWASAVACHELFHVARGCNGNAADHAWMAARHVDERCAEAVRGLSNLTGSTGASE